MQHPVMVIAACAFLAWLLLIALEAWGLDVRRLLRV
jgi:hypothetical protein